MSSLALPPLAQAQAPLDSRADWITPQEQLNRLHLPVDITRIEEEITRLFPLISVLAKLVAQYVGDKSVTNWYTALRRLNSLPEKIPPLPVHIYQIMNGKCPIYAGQLKADKTAYKIRDTHFLSLVPKEFGNLNRFERDILKPYGEWKYSEENHPLQFRYFYPTARVEYAYGPFPDTHWILMTKDVLPGSRNKTWDQQVALVNSLRKKASVNYEIPTLQQSFAGITTDMVATGKRHYRDGDTEDDVDTYTRVKESTQGSESDRGYGYHVLVGGFNTSGVNVSHGFSGHGHDYFGVGVLRKF